MSLSTGRGQLSNAFKRLKADWEATENVWRDIIRKEFAEEFGDPLATRMAAVLTAMDRLDGVLGQMKADCGDREF